MSLSKQFNESILKWTAKHRNADLAYRGLTRQAGVADLPAVRKLLNKFGTEKFRDRCYRNIAYAAAQWASQPPTLIVVFVEIIKVLDNLMGFINIGVSEVIRGITDFVKEVTTLLARTAPEVSKRFAGVRASYTQGLDTVLNESGVSAICAGVATILSGLVLGVGACSFPDGWKIVKKLSDTGRSISNIDRGLTSGWKILEYVFGKMKSLFDTFLGRHALSAANEAFSQYDINIEAFVTLVDSYVNPMLSYDEMKYVRTTANVRHLRNVSNKIEGLLLHDLVKLPTTTRQIVYQKMQEFRTYLKGNNQTAEDLEREIPYGVAIVGDPGTGKSLAMQLIARKLTEFGVVEGSPYAPGDIHNWNPAKKYMDGYQQQAIVTIDDMNAQKDVPGGDNPDLKYLLMFSNSPYLPEFAALEDKGRAFTSEVIISTSNTAYPIFNSMRSDVAFWRRRNLLFEQSVIENANAAEACNWRFRRMRPVRASPVDPGFLDSNHYYSFAETLAIIVDGLETWRASQSTDIKDVEVDQDLLKKLRLQRGKKQATKLQKDIEKIAKSGLSTTPKPDEDVATGYTEFLERRGIGHVDARDRVAAIERFHRTVYTMMRRKRLQYLPVGGRNSISMPVEIVSQFGRFQYFLIVNGNPVSFGDILEWFNVGVEPEMSDYDLDVVELFAREYGISISTDTTRRCEYLFALLKTVKCFVTGQRTHVQSSVTQGWSGYFFRSDMGETSEESGLLAEEPEEKKLDQEAEVAWFKNSCIVLKGLKSSPDEPWYASFKPSEATIEWIKVITGTLAVVGAAIGMYVLVSRGQDSPPKSAEEGLNYDGRGPMQQIPVARAAEGYGYQQAPGVATPVATMAEGCANLNTLAMINGKISRNTYFLTLVGAGRSFAVNAVFLDKLDLCFPKHALAIWAESQPDDEIVVVLEKMGMSWSESVRYKNFKAHPSKDFMMVSLTEGKVNAHASLLKWFANDENLGKNCNGFTCATVSIAPDNDQRTLSYHYGHAHQQKTNVRSSLNGDSLYTVNGYSTDMMGVAGLCGRLLVDTTAGTDKPIVGVHVSGLQGTNDSFFYPLTLRDYNVLKGNAIDSVPMCLELESIAEEFGPFFQETKSQTAINEQAEILCTGYDNVAIVSNRLKVVPNYKTGFKPTLLHDLVMENKHAPSPLSLKNPMIDPAVKEAGVTPQALAEVKYTKRTRPFPKALLEFAKEGLKAKLMPMTYDGDWEVMNLDQALNGDGKYLNPMDMHTSPGTELQKMSDSHMGKHAYVRRQAHLDAEGNLLPECEQRWEIRDEIHKPTGVGGITNRGQYLLKELDRIEGDLKNGRETFSPASSTMKDETLPLAKVWVAKVRLFMTLAMTITIITRRYFGSFLAAQVKCCTEIPLAIGLDAYGPAWTRVFNRMNKWGGKCIAADFKLFDAQADGECQMNAVDVISDIYDIKSEKPDPVGRRVRHGLAYLFIHTYVVCRNLMYRKSQGIPSGIPLTAPLNSCVNVQYLIMCVKTLTMEAGFDYSVNELMEMIELLVYGDDFVLAISPDLDGIISYTTMRDWFARYAITITPETKDGEDYQYRKLTDEVTFLKRKWSPEPGDPSRMRAPIEMDTIAGIINWQRKNHPPVEMMKDLIDRCYLQELFHHGRTAYNKGLQALNVALQKKVQNGTLPPGMTAFYADDYKDRHKLWLTKFN